MSSHERTTHYANITEDFGGGRYAYEIATDQDSGYVVLRRIDHATESIDERVLAKASVHPEENSDAVEVEVFDSCMDAPVLGITAAVAGEINNVVPETVQVQPGVDTPEIRNYVKNIAPEVAYYAGQTALAA